MAKSAEGPDQDPIVSKAVPSTEPMLTRYRSETSFIPPITL